VSARDDILGRVRAALGRPASDAAGAQDGAPVREAAGVRAAADALLGDLPSTRPALPAGSLAEAFIARVTSPKVAATAQRIESLDTLPAAVAEYLKARGLPTAVALQPHAQLRSLDWSGFELHPRVAADEAAAVGLARWGIAETGSLVFHSGADSPVLANFLPLHHIVALPAADILAHLEDYAAAVVGQPMPRNVNLITGASGTTDIEGSLVLGAHGPRGLHVVVIGA
jgi:L-lactate dehydrogenase complex protein LldG